VVCRGPSFCNVCMIFYPQYHLLTLIPSVGQTENGWTSDFIGQDWLVKSFIPQVRAREPDVNEPVLIILDGHGSHNTTPFVEEAARHNIHVLMLPPHTTHKTQPLDVGCFGPLKRQWIERCESHLELTGEPIARADFVKEYLVVRDRAVTPELVRAAFRKTGIAPYNPTIFSAADFGPSQPSSTRAHLPESFPSNSPESADRNLDSDDWDDDSSDEWDDEDMSDVELEMDMGEEMDWERSPASNEYKAIGDNGTWLS
jgi:hypothetical protein